MLLDATTKDRSTIVLAETKLPMTTLAHAELTTPIGPVHLFGTELGLITATLPNESYEQIVTSLQNRLGFITISSDTTIIADAIQQFNAYFAGELHTFDLRLAPLGTPFQRQVWEAVAMIPYGETRTYLEVAASIHAPTAVRAVGAANSTNPLPIVIPCHRVIGSNGKLHGYRGGIEMKHWLLQHEGAK